MDVLSIVSNLQARSHLGVTTAPCASTVDCNRRVTFFSFSKTVSLTEVPTLDTPRPMASYSNGSTIHPQHRWFWLGAAMLALSFALGCPASKNGSDAKDASLTSTSTLGEIEVPAGTGPVATVNGTNIPREPFNKEYKQTLERYRKAKHEIQPALRERIKDNIVGRLVNNEIVQQKAKQMQVELTTEEKNEKWTEHKKRYGTEEAFKAFLERAGSSVEDLQEQFWTNQLKEKLFAKVTESVQVSPQEVKEFFEQNKARYDEPEQVQASHILIKIMPTMTPEEKAAKKKIAADVLKKVKAKGADFAALAKEFGEDPTKDRGGDLGYFAKGRMVKPFEDAVWTMKKGQISNVVETQFGYHIIKKVDHKKEHQKPLKEVEEQIQKSIEARKKNQLIRDSLTQWKNEAKIEIFVKGDEAVIQAARAQAPQPGGMPVPGAPGMGQMDPQQRALMEQAHKGMQMPHSGPHGAPGTPGAPPPAGSPPAPPPASAPHP